MLEKLRSLNVIIHDIEELTYANGHNNQIEMRVLRTMIRKLQFGSGGDVARMLIMKEFGGIYLDLDNKV